MSDLRLVFENIENSITFLEEKIEIVLKSFMDLNNNISKEKIKESEKFKLLKVLNKRLKNLKKEIIEMKDVIENCKTNIRELKSDIDILKEAKIKSDEIKNKLPQILHDFENIKRQLEDNFIFKIDTRIKSLEDNFNKINETKKNSIKWFIGIITAVLSLVISLIVKDCYDNNKDLNNYKIKEQIEQIEK